jgi:hypothetical protein
MQTANILLALGGDAGNTVPKFQVTAAEIAILRAIHGDEAVFDIEPIEEEIEVSRRDELARLNQVYGTAKIDDGSGNKVSVVHALYPGAAAPVFTSLDDLEIPENFYKATQRTKPLAAKKPAKAAKKAPKSQEGADAGDEDEAGEMTDTFK